MLLMLLLLLLSFIKFFKNGLQKLCFSSVVVVVVVVVVYFFGVCAKKMGKKNRINEVRFLGKINI